MEFTFCHLYQFVLLVGIEVIHYYKAEKKKKKTMFNRCPPRNRSWSAGLRVRRANHWATRADRASPQLTIYFEYTIRISAIFLFAYTVYT